MVILISVSTVWRRSVEPMEISTKNEMGYREIKTIIWMFGTSCDQFGNAPFKRNWSAGEDYYNSEQVWQKRYMYAIYSVNSWLSISECAIDYLVLLIFVDIGLLFENFFKI